MSLNPEAKIYTPRQNQKPTLPKFISPEGAVFSYEPHLLGWHQEAKSDHTSSLDQPFADSEHFWHQDPLWVQKQLYYYQGIGFVDTPLYQVVTMDGHATFIGYRTKNGKQVVPVDKSQVRGRCSAMVEVYIGDSFVQKMPLRLLRRFSGAAKEQFPKPPQSKPPQKEAEKKADSVSVSSDAGPASRSQPITRSPTSVSDAPAATAFGQPKQKYLVLGLPGVDPANYPRATFVQQALNWMKSNQNENDGSKLLDYGPKEPATFSLLELLEIYQVALACRLQPSALVDTLRTELKERVTFALHKEVLELLDDITTYLPLNDSVTTRAIMAAWDRWDDQMYTADEWLAIKDFLLNNENVKLAQKAKGFFNFRMKGRKEREVNRFVESNKPTELPQEKSGRRRNRRAQQQQQRQQKREQA